MMPKHLGLPFSVPQVPRQQALLLPATASQDAGRLDAGLLGVAGFVGADSAEFGLGQEALVLRSLEVSYEGFSRK